MFPPHLPPRASFSLRPFYGSFEDRHADVLSDVFQEAPLPWSTASSGGPLPPLGHPSVCSRAPPGRLASPKGGQRETQLGMSYSGENRIRSVPTARGEGLSRAQACAEGTGCFKERRGRRGWWQSQGSGNREGRGVPVNPVWGRRVTFIQAQPPRPGRRGPIFRGRLCHM